jgi:hypothetical protein
MNRINQMCSTIRRKLNKNVSKDAQVVFYKAMVVPKKKRKQKFKLQE